MTARKKFKQRVRERMAQTGESYTAARRHLETQTPPSRDLCAGCECIESEVGLLFEQADGKWLCRACAQQSGGRS
jgi:hypothetical protein